MKNILIALFAFKILISKKEVCTVLFSTLLILFVPLIVMQFTNEVNWDASDFFVAGVLLFIFGYLFKVLTKSSNNQIKSIVIGMVVLGMLILVWANLI
jgi:hypothetical protein